MNFLFFLVQREVFLFMTKRKIGKMEGFFLMNREVFLEYWFENLRLIESFFLTQVSEEGFFIPT